MTTPAHRDDQGASEQGNWSCDQIGVDPPKRKRGNIVAFCILGMVVILGVGVFA
jgi:hypothetical protein